MLSTFYPKKNPGISDGMKMERLTLSPRRGKGNVLGKTGFIER